MKYYLNYKQLDKRVINESNARPTPYIKRLSELLHVGINDVYNILIKIETEEKLKEIDDDKNMVLNVLSHIITHDYYQQSIF